MDKKIVIRNFSRYAYIYDRYADVQRRSALELLSQIKEDRFNKILELGCGTGNYTFLLREKFKKATLKAVDICEKMVEVAYKKLKDKEIEFMVADAEDVNLDGNFDFITSNACFQWFSDLEKALIKYNNLLNKNGIILFSMFGPLTFWELNQSLRYILKDTSVEANNFINKEKIEKILDKNFKEIEIKENIYKESFLHLKDVLRKIKYSGIRGRGINGKIYFSPRILKELEEYYLHKFKELKVTYQIFFCKGLKA